MQIIGIRMQIIKTEET